MRYKVRPKKEFITIGTETFEKKKDIELKEITLDNYINTMRNTTKTLDMCYGRPSEIKRDIYNKWYNTLRENTQDLLDFGVLSYNCNMFTIGATIKLNDKYYSIYITKTRQEIQELIFN